jgi:hypothetical protein
MCAQGLEGGLAVSQGSECHFVVGLCASVAIVGTLLQVIKPKCGNGIDRGEALLQRRDTDAE